MDFITENNKVYKYANDNSGWLFIGYLNGRSLAEFKLHYFGQSHRLYRYSKDKRFNPNDTQEIRI